VEEADLCLEEEEEIVVVEEVSQEEEVEEDSHPEEEEEIAAVEVGFLVAERQGVEALGVVEADPICPGVVVWRSGKNDHVGEAFM